MNILSGRIWFHNYNHNFYSSLNNAYYNYRRQKKLINFYKQNVFISLQGIKKKEKILMWEMKLLKAVSTCTPLRTFARTIAKGNGQRRVIVEGFAGRNFDPIEHFKLMDLRIADRKSTRLNSSHQ